MLAETLKNPSVRAGRLRRAGFAWILLAAVSNTGCPVVDPYTETRIINDTATTIRIDLVLDRDQWRHGFEPEAYQQWLAERSAEWIHGELEAYARPDDGVELISVDAARIAGAYVLSPSAFMIVNASMGTSPYARFSTLRIGRGDQTATYSGEVEILKLFRPVGPGQFEFRVSEVF